MQIYLATWLYEPAQGEAMTIVGHSNRLISYHFLNDQGVTTKQLAKYIATGKNKLKSKKK